MAKRTNRAAWGLAAVLAVVVLVSTGLLLVRMRPYLTARFWGHSADLRGVVLAKMPLAGANLSRARLTEAELAGADLSRATLGEADLHRADLRRSNLSDAWLGSAWLVQADLRGAVLVRANLRHANLAGADLRQANLACADLREVRLTSLPGDEGPGPPDLTGAICDRHTRWPTGFDPQRHGVVMCE
jgi:uncharacterized protein YjbI with pentapeptide repeats